MTELKEAFEYYEGEKKLQFEQTKFLFEQSRTYHTVVMGLAYGGFFALWSASKQITGENHLIAFAGAAMLFSISFFVLFTILNMYVLSKITSKNAQIAQKFNNSPKTAAELNELTQKIAIQRENTNIEIKKASANVALLWPWFFYPSLLSGMAAMLLLLYVFVKHI